MQCVTWFLLLVRLSCGLVSRGGKVTVTSTGANTTGQNNTISFMKNMSGNGPGLTFRGWYDGHATGRGIWKWENALDAYQRHFGNLAGYSLAIAEVGVQSGGSLLMWQDVLGAGVWLYGLDINPKCKAFEGHQVSVTLGDQADATMWANFFQNVAYKLDILIDDGGHEAHQMFQTLVSPWPHIQPGGHIAIEDIHGLHYLDTFFKPVAWHIGTHWSGTVNSVHVYPFLLIVKKTGKRDDLPVNDLDLSHVNAVHVSNFDSMWAAIQQNPGSQVVLQNPDWGSFFTSDGLTNIFSYFNGLHGGAFADSPQGCRTTSAAVCTNAINPSTITQKKITGVHIYTDRVVVETIAVEPVLRAVRRGTEWNDYAGF